MDRGVSLFLTYALPPLLGALIGYVTNAVAIKMLFRPFREVRVLGVRIPFTPGIIPRQRHALALSIGRMVSRELLTEESLRRRIEDPAFRRTLSERVSGLSQFVLDFRFPVSTGNGPAETDLSEDTSVRVVLEKIVEDVLKSVFNSTQFSSFLSDAVFEFSQKILSRPLDENVVAALSAGLFDGDLPEKAFDLASEGFLSRIEAGAGLADFIPAGYMRSIESGIGKMYPAVLNRFLLHLRSPDMKRELALRGRFILRDILAELSFFQRLILSAGQYDRTLEEKMPKIVEDLLSSLEEAGQDEYNRTRVVNALSAEFLRLSRMSLADAAAGLGFSWAEALSSMRPQFALFVRSDQVRRHLEETLSSRSVGSLLPGLTSEKIADTVIAFLRPRLLDSGRDLVLLASRRLQDFFSGKTLSEIIRLKDDAKNSLDLFLSEKILTILYAKLPSALAVFDVESLVVQKIDHLDVRDVETMLLSVISRHLAWINVFGGILGALIGGMQVVINLIR